MLELFICDVAGKLEKKNEAIAKRNTDWTLLREMEIKLKTYQGHLKTNWEF